MTSSIFLDDIVGNGSGFWMRLLRYMYRSEAYPRDYDPGRRLRGKECFKTSLTEKYLYTGQASFFASLSGSILEIHELRTSFSTELGLVKAVDGIDLVVE